MRGRKRIYTDTSGGGGARDEWQPTVRANALTDTLGTHAMRKTFAKRVYEGLHHDLVKTQRAMGHRNVNSTVSYLSFREADIDAAILAS